MKEAEKSIKRRSAKKNKNLFRGYGIDIGAGNAGLNTLFGYNCYEWDTPDGDAQLMAGVPDNSYDWVHASHCLEHMVNPYEALTNWTRILKPGGHMIITVPDWEMYEREVWPSQFNSDHKWAFTCNPDKIGPAYIIYVPNIPGAYQHDLRLKSIVVIDDKFKPNKPVTEDQTLGDAECAIEIIFKKYVRNYEFVSA